LRKISSPKIKIELKIKIEKMEIIENKIK